MTRLQDTIAKITSRYPDATILEFVLEVWEGDALDGDTEYFKDEVGISEQDLYEVVQYAYAQEA